MKILFRVDGGENIGLGHIMRTLVLANQLKKDHNVKYVCQSSYKYRDGVNKIKEQNIEVIKIEEDNELGQIKKIHADMIIIDKYNIKPEYLKSLKEKFKVVYFDDNADLGYYPVDILINQNAYSHNLIYNSLSNSRLLLGCKYTLLREEFKENKTINVNSKIKNIFITVGGSDHNNITEKIINFIKDYNYNLHIIIGPSFKYKNKLKKYIKDNIILYENANMSNVMKICDVAISACGSTIYELGFLGIPTLGIIVAENQKRCGIYMDKIGAIKLTKLEHIKNNILDFDYNKRLHMHKIQKSIIDNKGVFRLKQEIEMYDK